MPLLRIVSIGLAIAAVLLALALPALLSLLRRRTGFNFGVNSMSTVVASDVGAEETILMRDEILGISGKPDYLLETDAGGRRVLVPLEVKPTRRSERLYDSDRVQIGAYLVVLRATFPSRASRIGYVRYATQTFEVVLTPELQREVQRLVAAVRRGRNANVIHRSHNIRARCRACPVRQSCNEALPD